MCWGPLNPHELSCRCRRSPAHPHPHPPWAPHPRPCTCTLPRALPLPPRPSQPATPLTALRPAPPHPTPPWPTLPPPPGLPPVPGRCRPAHPTPPHPNPLPHTPHTRPSCLNPPPLLPLGLPLGLTPTSASPPLRRCLARCRGRHARTQISRDTVAAVAVAALVQPSASNKVVEVVASPSAPPLAQALWFP